MTTRVQRNKNMGKLQAGYLFPEVGSYVCGCTQAAPLVSSTLCSTPTPPACPLPAPPLACAARPLPPPQIARRRKAHQELHPDAKIISLGIGDTTEPIPPFIAGAMQAAAAGLGTMEGYSGWVMVCVGGGGGGGGAGRGGRQRWWFKG